MSSEIKRRGLMLVLSSPSGAGKTTLSRRLLESDGSIVMSVSATTRAMRPNEVEGRDYFFVSKEKFQAMAKAGEFLEHATVFGNSYGTPARPVMGALAAGRDVLFDIDWQGAQQLKEKARDDLVSVFILPPSHDELERRLHTRAQDSEDVVRARMEKAAGEISHWPEYDYVIVNRDVDIAHTQIKSVLEAERVRRTRQIGLSEFVSALTGGE
ncbi:MAG: guanylate kinase [Alphaproteobacteria bacterium]|nr:guanylate kinase [Alphaproteobacteria bacterium]MBU6471036.1 guanylate kinase [Alphaproteobacteria bacterium]MDE2013135.1 guanylate kinase [Alphaproteobacteria bacterium]MDE2072752.1 guanylate kinase [Alphaproteobacteria bacterium]MDE2352126.1 guanylate kinase [Alphaproteobacteria bacterium]